MCVCACTCVCVYVCMGGGGGGGGAASDGEAHYIKDGVLLYGPVDFTSRKIV